QLVKVDARPPARFTIRGKTGEVRSDHTFTFLKPAAVSEAKPHPKNERFLHKDDF
ncbi:MAG: hypothetical protein ACI9KS_002943, partial [Sulfitobacter sp.]